MLPLEYLLDDYNTFLYKGQGRQVQTLRRGWAFQAGICGQIWCMDHHRPGLGDKFCAHDQADLGKNIQVTIKSNGSRTIQLPLLLCSDGVN